MKKKNHKLTLGKEIISSLIKVEIKGGKNSIPWGIVLWVQREVEILGLDS
ncbi:MAG: hypothetical protein IPH74_06400 [Bacteroidetes bacterium]|nr:hypothetical protein [Bacteroidota bacterium]